MAGPVVLLAGGTGGAKLARGLLDVAGADLVVIANTGDDIEIYGGHVSPDPDLVTFWLADRIDERGWGLRGDTFAGDGRAARARRRRLVQPRRPRPRAVPAPRAPARGGRPADGGDRRGARALRRARPACCPPATTRSARTSQTARRAGTTFQEFMIRERGAGPIEDVEFRGARRRAARARGARRDRAAPAPIIIGPSNPVALDRSDPGRPGPARRAARHAGAGRRRLAARPRRGAARARRPTCMRWAGHALDSDGIAAVYAGLLDGLVADQRAERRADARDRRRARHAGAARATSPQRTVAFAEALRD